MIDTELKKQFIKAIKKKAFVLRNCSICGYSCSYFYKDNQLYYDAGCDCASDIHFHLRPESELDYYLKPQNGHLDRIKEFIAEQLGENI